MDMDGHGWGWGKQPELRWMDGIFHRCPQQHGWHELPARGVRRLQLSSPNGADSYQPRAERSDALGWIAVGNSALKGRAIAGAARRIGPPLQGFVATTTPTQGDALGWYGTAPLGLDGCSRLAGRNGCDAGSVVAKTCPVRLGVSGSLSSVRNGGEGWGEEALRRVGPLASVGHPSPRPSPRSCLTGRGRRTCCLLQRSWHDLSQRLIFGHARWSKRKSPAISPGQWPGGMGGSPVPPVGKASRA